MSLAHRQRQADALPLALLIAAALHALVIFGITFDSTLPARARHQVEVTLLQRPDDLAPDDARHRAAQNQRGEGREALRDRASSSAMPLPATSPSSPEAALGNHERGGRRRFLASTQAPRNLAVQDAQRSDAASEPRPGEQAMAVLEQRLNSLESQLAGTDNGTSRERVRRLDAVAARSADDAAYLAAWRQRVEAVGNHYYPEASLRYGIFGQLQLLVTVRSDGQLESVEILETSGQRVLDEAAVRIVRMAAPFPPFPAGLRATTDRLEIVRTWQFEQNPLSSE